MCALSNMLMYMLRSVAVVRWSREKRYIYLKCMRMQQRQRPNAIRCQLRRLYHPKLSLQRLMEKAVPEPEEGDQVCMWVGTVKNEKLRRQS